jgi:hypothetical protein
VHPRFEKLLESWRPTLDRLATRFKETAPPVFESVLLAGVEHLLPRTTIQFDGRARARARALLPSMRKSIRQSNWARFPKSAGRVAFLAAAHSLVRAKTKEHVVIGLGAWTGTRSVVREVFVREGSEGEVKLPDSVKAEVHGYLLEHGDAEVLHVHNHPPGLKRAIKNALIGEAPIPSTSDRRVLLAHMSAATEANTLGGRRSVRFHLVENEYIHEYTLPPWEQLRPFVEEALRSMGPES